LHSTASALSPVLSIANAVARGQPDDPVRIVDRLVAEVARPLLSTMAHALSCAKAATSAVPWAAESSAFSASSFNPQNASLSSGPRQAWQSTAGSVKTLTAAAQTSSYAQAARQSPTQGAGGPKEQSRLEGVGSRVMGSLSVGEGAAMAYSPAMQSRLAPGGVDIRFGSFAADCELRGSAVGNGPAAACGNSRGGKTELLKVSGQGKALPTLAAVSRKSSGARSTVTCKAAHRGFGRMAGGGATPHRQRGGSHASPLKVVALQTPLGQSRNLSSKRLDLEDKCAFPKLTPPAPRRTVSVRAAKGKKGGAGKAGAEEETGPLKRGVMVEFEREGGGGNKVYHVGVLQRPDGKKNWMVTDQLGNNHSIRPQQVTFLVPPKANQASA
jgi:hypothetical protein